jgi:hypothetical protein
MGLGHGAIMSAATLERPRLASSPPGTLCIRRDARTPLVVTPMQAVNAGPRHASRSILPLTPSSCFMSAGGSCRNSARVGRRRL